MIEWEHLRRIRHSDLEIEISRAGVQQCNAHLQGLLCMIVRHRLCTTCDGNRDVCVGWCRLGSERLFEEHEHELNAHCSPSQ